MTNPLKIFSEPYAPSGAMSASGIGKLLGAPQSDRLQVVIRESIQNSWDARAQDERPEWRMRVFSPNRRQIRAMSEQVFVTRSNAADATGDAVADCLASDSLRAIEISDFGTRGLGGPVHSNVVPRKGERTDYVDFVLNVGQQRDRELGGGTYGYGKSSFFALSECSTVVIHSVTPGESGRNEHRLIASRLGPSFDVRRGARGGRFTGRHWWGDQTSGLNGVTPLRGSAARRMAVAIGMTPRSDTETGTSVLVLAPMFPTRGEDDQIPLEPDELANHIVRSVLWNAWPKLVPIGNARTPPMRLSASVDEVPLPILAPKSVPPYDKLAEALVAVRAGGEKEIIRYNEVLGTLAFKRWPRKAQSAIGTQPLLAPVRMHHVILMRPAELVVEALEGPDDGDQGIEWAGVFMCSNLPEIEKSFAESEPPAHDSWNPDNLRDKVQKSRVKVALRKIRDEIRDFTAPTSETLPPGLGSLASAATLLGKELMGLPGTGAGVLPNGRKASKGPLQRKERISRPIFVGLESSADGTRACFECEVTLPVETSRHLVATPHIVSDTGSEDQAPNGRRSELLGWSVDGNAIEAMERLSLQGPVELKVRVFVSVPDFVAVGVTVTFSPNEVGT